MRTNKYVVISSMGNSYETAEFRAEGFYETGVGLHFYITDSDGSLKVLRVFGKYNLISVDVNYE